MHELTVSVRGNDEQSVAAAVAIDSYASVRIHMHEAAGEKRDILTHLVGLGQHASKDTAEIARSYERFRGSAGDDSQCVHQPAVCRLHSRWAISHLANCSH